MMKITRTIIVWSIPVVAGVIAAMGIAACRSSSFAVGTGMRADTLSPLWRAYYASVYDAAIYNHGNLRKLNAIPADSTSMVVVTLTKARYNYEVGKTMTLGRYIWVTLVPEVRDSCRRFSGDVRLHLEQLLGLPPSGTDSLFIVMRVARTDIFRPTPDPTTATSYPCADPSDPLCGNAYPKGFADSAHIAWISTNTMSVYQMPNGYPWTHLGYTYNWSPGSDRYGASEYVIKPTATVTVLDIVPYNEYCAAH
jgi:hypothetical protein